MAACQKPVANVDDLHKRLIGDGIGVEATLSVLRGQDKIDLKIIPSESRRAA